MVERVHSRLEGWKVRCLSRAGKLTLAQSVLTWLPIFQMQLERLPSWVHWDKAVRSCVWRGYGGKRRVHLLKWETLIKPKEFRGANLMLAREMDWALFAKLAWRIMTCEGKVWRDVMKAKYGIRDGDGAHFGGRHRASQIWRGVVWGAELLWKGPV